MAPSKMKMKRRARKLSRDVTKTIRSMPMAPDMDEARAPSARHGVPMQYIGIGVILLAVIIISILYATGVIKRRGDATDSGGGGGSTTLPPGSGGGGELGPDTRESFVFNRSDDAAKKAEFRAKLATINPQTKRFRLVFSGSPNLGHNADFQELPESDPIVDLKSNASGTEEVLLTMQMNPIGIVSPPYGGAVKSDDRSYPKTLSIDIESKPGDRSLTFASRDMTGFFGKMSSGERESLSFAEYLRSTTDVNPRGSSGFNRMVIETNPSNFYTLEQAAADADAKDKETFPMWAIALASVLVVVGGLLGGLYATGNLGRVWSMFRRGEEAAEGAASQFSTEASGAVESGRRVYTERMDKESSLALGAAHLKAGEQDAEG